MLCGFLFWVIEIRFLMIILWLCVLCEIIFLSLVVIGRNSRLVEVMLQIVVVNVVVMLWLSLFGLVRFFIIVIRLSMVLMMLRVGVQMFIVLNILVLVWFWCFWLFSLIFSMCCIDLGLMLFISSCRFLCRNGFCCVFICDFRFSRFWWWVMLFYLMICWISLWWLLCGGCMIQCMILNVCLNIVGEVCSRIVVMVLMMMIMNVVGDYNDVRLVFLRMLLLISEVRVRKSLMRLSLFMDLVLVCMNGI